MLSQVFPETLRFGIGAEERKKIKHSRFARKDHWIHGEERKHHEKIWRNKKLFRMIIIQFILLGQRVKGVMVHNATGMIKESIG